MIKQIKSILILTLLCFSCHTEEPTEVKEITYLARENCNYGIVLGINSLFFLTQEVGFSFMEVRKALGQYPIGTVFRKTIDGGKTWETQSFFKDNVKGIQYWNGILYAYYNKNSCGIDSILTTPSYILFSKDIGKTWEKLYEFDNDISNFYVFDSLNMSIIKRENDAHWVYQSRNGGKTWKNANIPYVLTTSYISRDGNKLYFFGADDSPIYREAYLYNYDVISGILDKQIFKVPSIFGLYVSDGMLSMDINGCNIKYYTLEDGQFKLISKIRWGAWRRGSVSADLLAKDGKYVFSFISQFPGRKDMTNALYFSETGGKKWREIRTFDSSYGIDSQTCNIYRDDTTFQIAYASKDSLKIFRIKKNRI